MSTFNILLIGEEKDRSRRVYKYDEKVNYPKTIEKSLKNHEHIVTLKTLLDVQCGNRDFSRYDFIIFVNEELMNIASILESLEKNYPEVKVIHVKFLDEGDFYSSPEKKNHITINKNSVFRVIDKINELKA